MLRRTVLLVAFACLGAWLALVSIRLAYECRRRVVVLLTHVVVISGRARVGVRWRGVLSYASTPTVAGRTVGVKSVSYVPGSSSPCAVMRGSWVSFPLMRMKMVCFFQRIRQGCVTCFCRLRFFV